MVHNFLCMSWHKGYESESESESEYEYEYEWEMASLSIF